MNFFILFLQLKLKLIDLIIQLIEIFRLILIDCKTSLKNVLLALMSSGAVLRRRMADA